MSTKYFATRIFCGTWLLSIPGCATYFAYDSVRYNPTSSVQRRSDAMHAAFDGALFGVGAPISFPIAGIAYLVEKFV